MVDQDAELDHEALLRLASAKGKISITNRDEEGITFWVKISKANREGQDGYFAIPPGSTETWKRSLYKRVTIVMSNNGEDSGVIQSLDHVTVVTTDCNSFDIVGNRLKNLGSPEGCL